VTDPPTPSLKNLRDAHPDLFERGFPLWETRANVHEMAWTRRDALEAIRLLAASDHFILGDDVWFIEDGEPRPAHDNWYVNLTGDTAADVDAGRDKAERFVRTYDRGDDHTVRFVLVWR
jgi:hypothetical protein